MNTAQDQAPTSIEYKKSQEYFGQINGYGTKSFALTTGTTKQATTS